MANTVGPSSLEKAFEKLSTCGFPFDDLPKGRADPLWLRIEEMCALTSAYVITRTNVAATITIRTGTDDISVPIS